MKKKTPLSTRLYVDTETFNEVNERGINVIKPYLIGVFFDKTNHFKYFKNISDFFNFILGLGEEIELFFFNATYDIAVILHAAANEYDEEFYWENLHYDKQKKFIFGEFYLKTLLYGNIKIAITDLWMYNKNMSIEKYAKLLYPNEEEKQKLTIDYDKHNLIYIDDKHIKYNNSNGEEKIINLTEELKYLYNDVRIMPDINKYITNQKYRTFDIFGYTYNPYKDRVLTIGALNKRLCHYYIQNEFNNPLGFNIFRYAIPDESEHIAMERGFIGGLTFQNNNYTHYRGNVYKIDVNSMYPNVEHKFPIPIGEILDTPPYDCDYVTWHKINISSLEYKEKYKFISTPIFDTKKLKKEFYVLDTYLKLAVEICNIEYTILSTKYQRTSTIMRGFVEKLYDAKLNAKNKDVRDAAKLLLNAGYGKKAEKRRIYSYIWKEYYEGDGYYLQKEYDEDATYESIFSGMFITYTARIILYDAITKTLNAKGIVLYADTDSLFVTICPCKIGIELDKYALGKWDNENVLNGEIIPFNGMYMLPNVLKKYYAYRDLYPDKYALAFSGIPKEVIENLSHEDKATVFNPNSNVNIVNKKRYSDFNRYSQIIILSTDFQTNSKIPITHILDKGVLCPLKPSEPAEALTELKPM